MSNKDYQINKNSLKLGKEDLVFNNRIDSIASVLIQANNNHQYNMKGEGII